LQVLYLCEQPQGCVGTGEPLLQRYHAKRCQTLVFTTFAITDMKFK